MSLLLPDGIDHLGDCPFILHQAIVSGLRILGYEEFPIDERPPRRIWMDNEALTAHWESVEKARKDGQGSGEPDEEEPDAWDHNAVELLTRG